MKDLVEKEQGKELSRIAIMSMSKNIVALHFALSAFLIFFGRFLPHGIYIFIGSMWFVMLFGVLPYVFDDENRSTRKAEDKNYD